MEVMVKRLFEEYSNEVNNTNGRQGALCGNIIMQVENLGYRTRCSLYPKGNCEEWLGELLRTMNLGQYPYQR
jgi:hypothetical protein